MTDSRAKGVRGERELAKKLREFGFHARRGQQYSGANGDADVIGVPDIHIECKWVEKLNINKAMRQSLTDARQGEKAVVMHKKNGEKWLVTMTLADWIELYNAWRRDE